MSDSQAHSSSPAALQVMVAAERRYEVAGLSRKVFLALLLVQLVGLAWYAGLYIELVRTGPINAIRLAAVFLGTLCLCIGALFVFLARPRGRLLFLASGLLLLYAVPLWGWAYAWAWVIGLGVALAGVGFRIIRRLETARGEAAANAG